MATSKAKRPILLAQARPQHAKFARTAIPARAKTARSGSPGAGGPSAQRQRRSIHPNPNSDSTGLIPVKTHVYRTIAELNSGFDKVVQELEALSRVRFFDSDGVTAMRNLICRVRAEANRDFSAAMHERERANAGHFARHAV